ncbi:MAG: prepilin-type N-terminal cleavage/methylation domain-containing protein [Verrucomicrobiota bacterium]
MQRSSGRSRGFTLVELLVATTLAGMVMLAMLSSYLFVGRSLARLAGYQALENEARKTLTYLRQDFAVAKAVKNGTTPTSTTLTLVLPTGQVTYTYADKKLRRQATVGSTLDFYLLNNSACECATFAFSYYTTTDGTPDSQLSETTLIPYSIKQIEVRFTLESPATWPKQRRTRFDAASSRFLIRNRAPPDGT